MSSNDATMLFRSDSTDALPTSYVLERDYGIREILGRGGFGITYKAHDRRLDIEVAIKEFFPAGICTRTADQHVEAKPEHRELFEWGRARFQQEAKTLARLTHKNVVRLFGFFQANGTVYSVLELVSGETLGMWLGSLQRRPTQGEMDEIFEPLIEGLGFIHGNNLLHRDLSQNTILLRHGDGRAGSSLLPVMLDFGAAKDFFRRDATMQAHVTA